MDKVIIGNCTLYHGDCLDILPTIKTVDALVTDPPYGMNFVSNYRRDKHKKIENDHNDKMLNLVAGFDAKHSKYIFCRWDNIYNMPKPKSFITWVKNNWSMGDLKHEHGRQTEIILFYSGVEHYFPQSRPSDVINAARTNNELHPTQKPLALMQQIVSWTSGVVLDPFMGSGTTGVACIKENRSFIGIEKDKRYFDIACKRIEEAYSQPDMFYEAELTCNNEQD